MRLILLLIAFEAVLSKPTYYDEAYMYHYGVNSHEYNERQNFGQTEHRNDNQVTGEWYVLLPNGLIQRVKYRVDEHSGFVADVTYEGVEKSPEYHSRKL